MAQYPVKSYLQTLPALGIAFERYNSYQYRRIIPRLLMQQDAHQAAIAALQREIKLLRAENAFLRDQVYF